VLRSTVERSLSSRDWVVDPEFIEIVSFPHQPEGDRGLVRKEQRILLSYLDHGELAAFAVGVAAREVTQQGLHLAKLRKAPSGLRISVGDNIAVEVTPKESSEPASVAAVEGIVELDEKARNAAGSSTGRRDRLLVSRHNDAKSASCGRTDRFRYHSDAYSEGNYRCDDKNRPHL